MKKKLILVIPATILFVFMLYLVATNYLSKKSEIKEPIAQEKIEETEDTTQTPVYSISSDGTIISEPLEDSLYLNIPTYYQNDYEYDFGKKTMSSAGNLITCLSMIYSHYSGMKVTPPIFAEAFKNYIYTDGTINEELFEVMVPQMEAVSCEKTIFDAEKMSHAMADGAIVLVSIEHPSVYCSSPTFLVLIMTDGFGNIIVRDPVKENAKAFSIESPTKFDETFYEMTPLFNAIGDTGSMYIFY